MRGRPAVPPSHADVQAVGCPRCLARPGSPCRLVLQELRTSQEIESHHPQRVRAARVAANRRRSRTTTAAMRAAEMLWRR
jgi:hypothetical protein